MCRGRHICDEILAMFAQQCKGDLIDIAKVENGMGRAKFERVGICGEIVLSGKCARLVVIEDEKWIGFQFFDFNCPLRPGSRGNADKCLPKNLL